MLQSHTLPDSNYNLHKNNLNSYTYRKNENEACSFYCQQSECRKQNHSLTN